MKIKNLVPSLLAAVLVVGGLTACETEENNPQLKAEAKISEADARQTAMAKVPNGTIKESGLEKEKGRLIWSFDIATPGTRNITEVAVDAITGAIVSVDTETPGDEAKEKSEEGKK